MWDLSHSGIRIPPVKLAEDSRFGSPIHGPPTRKHTTTEVKPLGISIPRVRKRDESDEDRGGISPPDQQVTKICPPLGDDVRTGTKKCVCSRSSRV